MGYGTRTSGFATIRTFEPDDTHNMLYIHGEHYVSMEQMLERAQAKWPGITPSELTFGAEHINTDCLGYDKYDFIDWTTYITLNASEEYFERTKEEKKDARSEEAGGNASAGTPGSLSCG